VNGQPGRPVTAPAIAAPETVPRFMAYEVPRDALQEAYNVVEVLGPEESSHELVWAEIRIDPQE